MNKMTKRNSKKSKKSILKTAKFEAKEQFTHSALNNLMEERNRLMSMLNESKKLTDNL